MTRRMFRYLALGLLTTNLATFSEGYAATHAPVPISKAPIPVSADPYQRADEFAFLVKKYLRKFEPSRKDQAAFNIIREFYNAKFKATMQAQTMADRISHNLLEGYDPMREVYLLRKLIDYSPEYLSELDDFLTNGRLEKIMIRHVFTLIEVVGYTEEQRMRFLEKAIKEAEAIRQESATS